MTRPGGRVNGEDGGGRGVERRKLKGRGREVEAGKTMDEADKGEGISEEGRRKKGGGGGVGRGGVRGRGKAEGWGW